MFIQHKLLSVLSRTYIHATHRELTLNLQGLHVFHIEMVTARKAWTISEPARRLIGVDLLSERLHPIIEAVECQVKQRHICFT